MVDLTGLAGMPIFLDGEALVFRGSVRDAVAARQRLVDTLKDVWLDPALRGKQVVYTTYLDVFKAEDSEIFGEGGLQHGYVVMPSGRYGREYPKLVGHYHPPAPGTSLGYPEVHMVLHGTAHFILQESVPPYEGIRDAVVVEAKAGEAFCVPPNYGHTTVNPSETTLVFEGFFARGFTAHYEPFKMRRGAVYYEMEAEGWEELFVKNERYPDPPELRRVLSSEIPGPEELRGEVSSYSAVVHNPGAFAFLRDPSQFKDQWGL